MIRRNYIVQADFDAVTDATQAQAALAEALIDEYVGWQDQHIKHKVHGAVSVHTSATKKITDTSASSGLDQPDNYFARTVIEIIGGTGVGGVRNITASDRSDKSVTYEGTDLTLDTTSVFKIYQLAKFPRAKDVYAGINGDTYAKTIPDAVREAAAAQLAFVVSQGDDFFGGVSSDMESESFLSYSYSRGQSSAGSTSLIKMIAPKARTLLRGIKNSTGRLVAGPDAWV